MSVRFVTMSKGLRHIIGIFTLMPDLSAHLINMLCQYTDAKHRNCRRYVSLWIKAPVKQTECQFNLHRENAHWVLITAMFFMWFSSWMGFKFRQKGNLIFIWLDTLHVLRRLETRDPNIVCWIWSNMQTCKNAPDTELKNLQLWRRRRT